MRVARPYERARGIAHAPRVSIPAGYEARRVERVELVAARAVASELANVVASHGTLYRWAAESPQPRALRGRAPVYVAALPRSGELVAVRHVWHGGLLAPITGDRFRLPTRAPRELSMSLTLRAHGIRTTEILGYALYPAGPGLRQVDVVTRYVPDADDLAVVLAGLAPSWTLEHAAVLVRRTMEQLAMHRLHHPDLNVKNLLLAPSAPDGALVIDVDVMEQRDDTPASVMARNRARLLRSVDKWQSRADIVLAPDARDRFVAALDGAGVGGPASTAAGAAQ